MGSVADLICGRLDSAVLTAGLLGLRIAGARLLGALCIAVAAGMATTATTQAHPHTAPAILGEAAVAVVEPRCVHMVSITD